MYALIINRKSSLTAASIDFSITLDEKPVGALANGKQLTTEVAPGHHTLRAYKGLIKKKQILEYNFNIPQNQTRTTLIFKVSNRNGNFELLETLTEFIDEKVVQQEIVAYKKKNKTYEHKMKCNVCSNIFCYTDSDKSNSDLNLVLTALACTSSALAKNKYDSYERGKIANSTAKNVRNFNICPFCNSRDIIEITNDTSTEAVQNNYATPSTTNDVQYITAELEKYKDFLELGLISQEEFDTKRKQLLNL